MIVEKEAYPRAGLIGNPSDGYFGKTIALVFSNFSAKVTLYETPELEILPNTRDHSCFASIADLAADVRLYGYYGGVRLLKAAVKRFFDHCEESGHKLADRNFTIRYASSIPHLVGLAGSSAIIVACLRALMEFYEVSIPRPVQANLVLSVEKEELRISAGLQDRVVQVYQGLVYMDFDRGIMESQGYGKYEELDPACLPPLYLAYRADLSQGSEIVHSDMHDRFDRGEPRLLEAIEFWADITEQVRDCLGSGKTDEIGNLLDSNFDMRSEVCEISVGNRQMIEGARKVGASAKFTGSGGAIIGTYEDDKMYSALQEEMAERGIVVLKPWIVPSIGSVE